MKKIFFTILYFLSLSAENKVIYMITPPRSLSTIFLRVMQARGDMNVFNEPAHHAFFKHNHLDELADYFPDTPFTSFELVKKSVLQARTASNIFVKEISFAAYDCFYNDDQFLQSPNIEFCFLIRDPHPSLISYYKAKTSQDVKQLHNISEWMIEWSIYQKQYALFKKITTVRNKTPLVIDSRDLTQNPEKIMRLFCSHMDIEYKDSMISWPSLKDGFNPLDWNDYKLKSACELWHKNAIVSTHFISSERKL